MGETRAGDPGHQEGSGSLGMREVPKALPSARGGQCCTQVPLGSVVLLC